METVDRYSVCFVINEIADFDFGVSISELLPATEYSISITTAFPVNPMDFDLVVLWRVKYIVHGLGGYSNVMVFHSSDLPNGKGWAPIYYTFKQKLSYCTVTGFIANEGADDGDVVIKARFPILSDYTAPILRKFTQRLILMMIGKVLSRFNGQAIKGAPQVGEGSFNRRRTLSENQVDLNQPLGELVAHLRGCEAEHPAYFFLGQTKYFIEIKPEIDPVFPKDIDIYFAVDTAASPHDSGCAAQPKSLNGLR